MIVTAGIDLHVPTKKTGGKQSYELRIMKEQATGHHHEADLPTINYSTN